jgi:hypothetical protein
MEGGVEGAFLDLKAVIRYALDPAEHGETMHRAPAQRLEHHEVERPANEVEIRNGHVVAPFGLRFLGDGSIDQKKPQAGWAGVSR